MVDIYVIGAKAVSQRAINSGVMNFCFVMNIWAEAAFAILAQCSYIMLFHVVVLQQQREEEEVVEEEEEEEGGCWSSAACDEAMDQNSYSQLPAEHVFYFVCLRKSHQARRRTCAACD